MLRLTFTNNEVAKKDAIRALVGKRAHIRVAPESARRGGEKIDCYIRLADMNSSNYLMVRLADPETGRSMAPGFRIIPEHIHILDA